jgi:predicted DNA-binding protein
MKEPAKPQKPRARLLRMEAETMQRIRLVAAHEDCPASRLLRDWIEIGLVKAEQKLAKRAVREAAAGTVEQAPAA